MCSFLSIFVLILLHYFSINCRLWYKGAPKYLGESVTGVGNWYVEFTYQFMLGWVGEIGQGHLQMCRQVGMTLLHMHEGFSHLNREADDCDIIS